MSRKLKIRVIHDSDLPPEDGGLGTDDFDLMPLNCYRGGQFTYLRRWEDHLRLWDQIAEGDDPETPDLYLIDCHYEQDEGPPPVATDIDGRGLLHGVVQLAYAIGKEPQHPFGFSVYSANPTRVKGDPYAVTNFGLMEAMRGNLIPFEDLLNSKRSLESHFSDSLDNLQHGGTPESAWPVALEMYRERLLWLYKCSAVALDPSSLDSAVRALRDLVDIGQSPDTKLAIKWIRPGKSESVLLSSMLADCRTAGCWNESQLEKVMEWLNQLQMHNWFEHFYEPATMYLDALDEHIAGDEITHPSIRIRGIAICMFIVRQLANKKVAKREMNRNAIESYFDLDPKQTSRAVEDGLQVSMTVNELIEILVACNQWPLDAVVYACVQKFLENNSMPPWPSCVH